MKSVDRRHVQYFNDTYSCTCTLREERYKATVINSDQYLLTCMRYIELNPMRAGMAAHPHDYPWSSYPANADGYNNKLITQHTLYRHLGTDAAERECAYRQLFRAAIGRSDLEPVREATNKGLVLGNNPFRERIERLSGRRAALKP